MVDSIFLIWGDQPQKDRELHNPKPRIIPSRNTMIQIQLPEEEIAGVHLKNHMLLAAGILGTTGASLKRISLSVQEAS